MMLFSDALRAAAEAWDALQRAPTPAPSAAIPTIPQPPEPSRGGQTPGNVGSASGFGTLGPITAVQVSVVNGSVRVICSGLARGYGVGLVSPSGAHDRGYDLVIVPDGTEGTAHGVNFGGEAGVWNVRVVDPGNQAVGVPYAPRTTPFFPFTVVL